MIGVALISRGFNLFLYTAVGITAAMVTSHIGLDGYSSSIMGARQSESRVKQVGYVSTSKHPQTLQVLQLGPKIFHTIKTFSTM